MILTKVFIKVIERDIEKIKVDIEFLKSHIDGPSLQEFNMQILIIPPKELSSL